MKGTFFKFIKKIFGNDEQHIKMMTTLEPIPPNIPQLMNELNISGEDMARMSDGKTVFLSNIASHDLCKIGMLYQLSGVEKVNVSLFIGDHGEHKAIVTEGKGETEISDAEILAGYGLTLQDIEVFNERHKQLLNEFIKLHGLVDTGGKDEEA